MEKVNLREFQRNFCKYQNVPCEVVKHPSRKDQSQTVMIGQWTPAGTVVEAAPDRIAPVPALVPGELPVPQPIFAPDRLCTMCKKNPPMYEGAHFEDGEEYKVQLCKVCYWRYPQKRNLKRIYS